MTFQIITDRIGAWGIMTLGTGGDKAAGCRVRAHLGKQECGAMGLFQSEAITPVPGWRSGGCGCGYPSWWCRNRLPRGSRGI
jgi:hypothetical protein